MHFWNFVYFEIQLFNLNSYEFTERVWIRWSCFFFFLLLKRVKTKISINCSISIYLVNNLEQKQKLLGFLVKRKRVRAFKEKKKKKYPVIKRHNTPWCVHTFLHRLRCVDFTTVWKVNNNGPPTNTGLMLRSQPPSCLFPRVPVSFQLFPHPRPFPPKHARLLASLCRHLASLSSTAPLFLTARPMTSPTPSPNTEIKK